MPTRALPEFADGGALRYPGIASANFPKGKTYTVPPPDADTGMRWASLGELVLFDNPTPAQLERLKLDDAAETSLYEQVLGDTLAEMKADGVPWPRIRQIAQDAFMYWAVNEQFADAVLASQGKEEARENRAARRAATKKPSSTARTPRPKAGSSSGKASTATPARTRARTSTRSSPPTPSASQGSRGQAAQAV